MTECEANCSCTVCGRFPELPLNAQPILELDEHAAWPMPSGGAVVPRPKAPTFKDRALDLVRWAKGER
jgi:hypothetical protein